MSTRNQGLVADALFVGATRPPMRWGVTYSALLFNMVFTLALIRTLGFIEQLSHLTDVCHGYVRWAAGDARREP